MRERMRVTFYTGLASYALACFVVNAVELDDYSLGADQELSTMAAQTNTNEFLDSIMREMRKSQQP